jgi:polygalacturonase
MTHFQNQLSAACAGLALLSSLSTARAVATPHLPSIPARTFNIADYGAIGDGVATNTAAFQAAISAAAKAGGGIVEVPAGFFLTGPIKLQSKINFHLDRGALIKFSGDYHLYPLIVADKKGEKSVETTSPISGENLENVAITGEGIIDGGGEAWRPVKIDKFTASDWKALVASGGVLDKKGETWWPSADAMNGEKVVAPLVKSNSLDLQAYEPAHQFMRPKMVHLVGCKRVLLQGVTFENPPNWTLNPAFCEDVSILNISIHNSYAAQNSDALDLESCRHVIIKDSTFDAGDDGICLKSGRDAVGRRIGGCTVYHAHGGFVIGSEMSGGMRDIHVNNCTFIGTDNGLRFKSARGRGGVVQDIFISNIRMENILGNAIDFEMFYETGTSGDRAGDSLHPVDEGTPRFQDIHIENLVCRGAAKAMVVDGLQEMPMHNVDLKNVTIAADKGAFITDVDKITFENVRVENKSGAPLTQTRVTNSSMDLAQ